MHHVNRSHIKRNINFRFYHNVIFVSKLIKICIVSIFCFSQGEVLETVTTAIVAFFNAQQSMLDQVPQLGHFPKIFHAMTSRNDAIPASAIAIVHTLADSQVSIAICNYHQVYKNIN